MDRGDAQDRVGRDRLRAVRLLNIVFSFLTLQPTGPDEDTPPQRAERPQRAASRQSAPRQRAALRIRSSSCAKEWRGRWRYGRSARWWWKGSSGARERRRAGRRRLLGRRGRTRLGRGRTAFVGRLGVVGRERTETLARENGARGRGARGSDDAGRRQRDACGPCARWSGGAADPRGEGRISKTAICVECSSFHEIFWVIYEGRRARPQEEDNCADARVPAGVVFKACAKPRMMRSLCRMRSTCVCLTRPTHVRCLPTTHVRTHARQQLFQRRRPF